MFFSSQLSDLWQVEVGYTKEMTSRFAQHDVWSKPNHVNTTLKSRAAETTEPDVQEVKKKETTTKAPAKAEKVSEKTKKDEKPEKRFGYGWPVERKDKQKRTIGDSKV